MFMIIIQQKKRGRNYHYFYHHQNNRAKIFIKREEKNALFINGFYQCIKAWIKVFLLYIHKLIRLYSIHKN